jgi:hypothetical protein
MGIKEKEPFWRDFRFYQVWRFTVLNFKLLLGVIHSKRLFKFVIKYKVSYVVKEGEHPPTIVNTPKPPQTGDRVQLGRNTFEVMDVLQLMPPRGEFCFLQANCKLVDDS